MIRRNRGVRLSQQKEPALSRPVGQYIFPTSLYLRLPAEDTLREGTELSIDEPAFTVKNQAVFSPIDAIVQEIVYPGFDPARPYALLRNTVTPTQRQIIRKNDVETITADRIFAYAKKCGVRDDIDGIYLYKKLAHYQNRRKLLVVGDAVDDEPFVSNHLGPLLKLTPEAVGGLKLAKTALGAAGACFAVPGHLGETQTQIPKELEGVPVVRLKGEYPARTSLRAEVQRRYRGYRVVPISVNTLIHLYRAVVYEKPHNTTFLTVCGDCIANAANLEVPMGTPVKELLRFCGLSQTPERVIAGGTMAGREITGIDFPVALRMKSLVALSDSGKRTSYECIGCGRCVKICPVGISPYLAYRYWENDNHRYRYLELDRCIQCGLCSYICPSNIDVASYVAAGREEEEEGSL